MSSFSPTSPPPRQLFVQAPQRRAYNLLACYLPRLVPPNERDTANGAFTADDVWFHNRQCKQGNAPAVTCHHDALRDQPDGEVRQCWVATHPDRAPPYHQSGWAWIAIHNAAVFRAVCEGRLQTVSLGAVQRADGTGRNVLYEITLCRNGEEALCGTRLYKLPEWCDRDIAFQTVPPNLEPPTMATSPKEYNDCVNATKALYEQHGDNPYIQMLYSHFAQQREQYLPKAAPAAAANTPPAAKRAKPQLDFDKLLVDQTAVEPSAVEPGNFVPALEAAANGVDNATTRASLNAIADGQDLETLVEQAMVNELQARLFSKQAAARVQQQQQQQPTKEQVESIVKDKLKALTAQLFSKEAAERTSAAPAAPAEPAAPKAPISEDIIRREVSEQMSMLFSKEGRARASTAAPTDAALVDNALKEVNTSARFLTPEQDDAQKRELSGIGGLAPGVSRQELSNPQLKRF